MVEAARQGVDKLKVFISYSRKDEDFAQDLLAGLKVGYFEPYLDKRDIAAGEDWQARLSGLIEAADTVVFVISPDAVASERCAWEVEQTMTLKKRLLPIVWRAVEEAKVPPHVKQLNYIFFDRPLSFGAALLALATALKTDINWIREHTRIGEAALRWDVYGRSEALLPRGEELAAAKDWLKTQPKYAPEPTLLHHEFIKAAEDAETVRMTAERQRLDQMAAALEREKAALRRGQRALAATGALFVCIVIGAIGWYNQTYLKEQYYWRVNMGPAVLSAALEKSKATNPGSDFRECANGCPVMVVVRSGNYSMGSPNEIGEKREHPQRQLAIARPFAVAKFEVSFEEWDTCAAFGDCSASISASGWDRGKQPVVNVTWQDAQQYVRWLSRMTGKRYRLLSEAEWEYTARGGTTTHFSFGNDDSVLGDYAWFSGNADGRPHAVGSRKANPWGFNDMHGNVAEWVEDCFHDTYNDAPTNVGPWVEGCDRDRRVIRGGSWLYGAKVLRAASRDWKLKDESADDVGFRIAREFDAPGP